MSLVAPPDEMVPRLAGFRLRTNPHVVTKWVGSLGRKPCADHEHELGRNLRREIAAAGI